MKSLLLLLPLAMGTLTAQTVIPDGAPPSYLLDGKIGEWTGLTPTFHLHPSKLGGREGSVWIRQIPEGLLVAGVVDGPTPDFAARLEDLPLKDHVEIWLAPSTPPAFPVIGYGTGADYQPQEVPNIDACAADPTGYPRGEGVRKCREWFQSVLVHRRLLARTFIRRYVMSPNVATEAFAKPAYEQMVARADKFERDNWTAIAPGTAAAAFRSAAADSGGYSFEAVLPWEAFPPLASLKVKNLKLSVDVYSAHSGAPKDQPYSSTSATRRNGDSSTFNPVVLATGRQFKITACAYPLDAGNRADKAAPGPSMFFPRRDDDVTQVFRLQNLEPFNEYRLFPYVGVTRFAERPMPGGAVVCGSKLAILRDGTVFKYTEDVDPDTLDVKLEPDGSFLVLSGASWRRATRFDDDGCWEGTPMKEFHAWLISPALQIKQIFETHTFMSGMAMGVVDMDVEVSPDASQIRSYLGLFSTMDKDTHWSLTTYCRRSMAYKECGHKEDVAPPKRKATQ